MATLAVIRTERSRRAVPRNTASRMPSPAWRSSFGEAHQHDAVQHRDAEHRE
jgi:hypothetical protein